MPSRSLDRQGVRLCHRATCTVLDPSRKELHAVFWESQLHNRRELTNPAALLTHYLACSRDLCANRRNVNPQLLRDDRPQPKSSSKLVQVCAEKRHRATNFLFFEIRVWITLPDQITYLNAILEPHTNGLRIARDGIDVCLNFSTHGPSTHRSSLRVDRLRGSVRAFSPSDVRGEKFLICILAVGLKLCVDHTGASRHRKFAFVRQPAPPGWRCPQISLLWTVYASVALHGRCLTSGAVQRHQLRCVFDPSSLEDLFLHCQRPGRTMRGLVLREIC